MSTNPAPRTLADCTPAEIETLVEKFAGITPAPTPRTVHKFALATWLSMYGRDCLWDFVKATDYAAMEAERADAIEREKYAWWRHAEKDRYYGEALSQRDQLRAEVERLGQNLAAIETAGGDEGASARMAMQAVEDRSRAEKAEARVTELERLLAAAGEDKARLDWLAEQIGPGYAGGIVTVANLIPTHGGSLRAAIDAARARKELP